MDFIFSWILRCVQNDREVGSHPEYSERSTLPTSVEKTAYYKCRLYMGNCPQPFFVRFFEHFTYCTSRALSFRCSADRSMPIKFAVCETFPENRLI